MGTLRDLELLIQSRYPIIVVQTWEEDRLEGLLGEIGARLDVPVFVWTLTQGLRRLGHVNAVYDSQAPLKALAGIAAMAGEAGIYLLKDLHHSLGDGAVVRRLLDLIAGFTARRAIVLCAAQLALPPELERVAARFTLDLPTTQELAALVGRVVEELRRQQPIRIELGPEETGRLVERLRGLTLFEAERALRRAILRDRALTSQDLEYLAELKRELLRQDGLLEYFTAEERLADVGGFRNLKAWLAKRSRALSPEAKQFGLEAPKGILLLGVQGCGKTLVARTVAREWGLPLLKLETGRVYDKYVGESEKNLEKALAAAEHMAPCVLMLDEIEKGLTLTSGASDAGLSRRIFGRLLGWLQDRRAPVFVVATCNEIGALPPELTRKGRFDEIFFIDLPSAAERREIFTIHLAKRKRDPAAFDLEALAAAADGWSGAEIEQAVVAGLYTAFARGSELTTEVLREELGATRPLSVTRREEVLALQRWAEGRTVPAS